jgi:hypothetical protein
MQRACHYAIRGGQVSCALVRVHRHSELKKVFKRGSREDTFFSGRVIEVSI